MTSTTCINSRTALHLSLMFNLISSFTIHVRYMKHVFLGALWFQLLTGPCIISVEISAQRLGLGSSFALKWCSIGERPGRWIYILLGYPGVHDAFMQIGKTQLLAHGASDQIK